MIARTWHGRVPAQKAEAYYDYMRRTGLADYLKAPGNHGLQVLRRTEGDVTHFLLVTLWDSVDSIQRFAGSDYQRARYYPEDDDYLLEREPHVTHYEVLSTGEKSMTETERIADQLDRAFDGDTWSGRSIREILSGLAPEQAAARPIPGAKSAWELLRHVTAWIRIARIRLGGQACSPTEDENFPPVASVSLEAWRAEWDDAEREYRLLADAIRRLDPGLLEGPVAGKPYDAYHLLHGVIQHSLYHAGQIALLARLLERERPVA